MISSWHCLVHLLEKWQVLATGVLALVAGYLAYRVGRQQIEALRATLQAETLVKPMDKSDRN
jgi:hypothetical protein